MLDRYILGKELGKGAFGIVYEAIDKIDGKSVAIKKIVWNDLFEGCPKEVANLQHISPIFDSYSQVLHCYDWFKEDGHLFIVTTLVKGVVLSHFTDDRFLDESELKKIPVSERKYVEYNKERFTFVWKLLGSSLTALRRIHSKGYAHTDISITNLMWDGEKTIIIDIGSCIHESVFPQGMNFKWRDVYDILSIAIWFVGIEPDTVRNEKLINEIKSYDPKHWIKDAIIELMTVISSDVLMGKKNPLDEILRMYAEFDEKITDDAHMSWV